MAEPAPAPAFSPKGYFLMLLSATLFATFNLMIKLLGPQYRVWDLAIFRFGGGFIILLSIFGWQTNLFKPRNSALMLLRGISGSCAFVFLILALQRIPLSTAMVIFYCYPAFAALFSTVVYKERVTASELICISMAIVGVAILFQFNVQGDLVGQCQALGGSVFAGITVTIIQKLRRDHGSVIIYFYFCFIGAAIATAPFLSHPQLPVDKADWVLLLALVLCATGAQLAMNQGYRYCKSWEGGLFMTSEVLIAALFGFLFLNEQLSWRLLFGGGLALGSAALLSFRKRLTVR